MLVAKQPAFPQHSPAGAAEFTQNFRIEAHASITRSDLLVLKGVDSRRLCVRTILLRTPCLTVAAAPGSLRSAPSDTKPTMDEQIEHD